MPDESTRESRVFREALPTAAEHSFGSSLLNWLHKLLETICVRVAPFFTGYENREAFSWLPAVVGRSKMNNSLRQ